MNFPFVELTLSSGPVAGAIMVILAFMSFGVWGVIAVKYAEHRKNSGANRDFVENFTRIEHFGQMKALLRTKKESPLKQLTTECLQEAAKFSAFVSYDSIQHRASLLEDTIQRSVEAIRLEEDRSLSFLALCSNLSPFLGLLGTVWGIMSSFYEVGKHGSADLTVVAPGIAAALITTIGGLLVAVPASAAYNIFVSRNNRNEMYYYNFASRVLSLFKRGDLLALEKVAGIGEEQ